MGRRGAVASAGSDSLPSSAESSFRELDDAFLQTQTRIWLGEVLNIRLDEDVHISDLLADGELLFEVSKAVWNLLLTKCAELWHLKENLKGPFVSRKSSGRYMPYSNVDSFLKICKILGLNGIDLFSPSDVVERKNTRKVCICIRALSKKARSKQLHVPDFDIVTYTVVMPTDMVGYIRRSLESSQSSFSSSSSYSSHKQSTLRFRQKKLISWGDQNDDSYSEESDEAESNYMGANSPCSTTNNLGNAAATHKNLESSPGAYSVSKEKQSTASQCASQYDIENQDAFEFENGQYKSQNISRSVKSTVKYSRNDHLAHRMSFDHVDSRSKLHGRDPCLNGDIQDRQSKNSPNFNLAYQNDDLVTGDTLGDNTAERDYISDYLAFSDSVVFGADGSSPVLPDGEDNSYNFFMGIDAHGSDFKGRIYENGNQRKDSDVEDEVSSTTSMSSILGRVLTMEFDDRFDLDASSATKDHSNELLENVTDENLDKGLLIKCEIRGTDEYEISSHGFTSDAKGHKFKREVENLGGFSKFFQPGNDEQLPTLESQDIECLNGPHRIPGKDLHLKDAKLFVLVKDKESGRDEDTDRVIIGSNMFGSDVDYEQKKNAQILADNCSNFSDTRPKDSNSSCNMFAVEGNKRCYCVLHNPDGVTQHISSHGTPETTEVHKTVARNSFDILPIECVPLEEMRPCSSAQVVGGASKISHQASSSVEKSLDCAEHANEECKSSKDMNMVESESDRRKDTTGGLSRDKPHQKLLKTVAKGTAIIGVLFLLVHVRRKVGEENGKARKKSGRMKNVRNAESMLQKGQKAGRVNGIYPAEKL